MSLKFLFVLLILISVANAADIKIYEGNGYSTSGSLNYEFNGELGRAWVVFTIPTSDPESMNEKVRIKVPGMSYSRTSIIMSHEGQEAECATVEERGRFRITRRSVILPTGRCKFSKKIIKIPFDDGFKVRYQERLHIFLSFE
jgi:hypothetical protein